MRIKNATPKAAAAIMSAMAALSMAAPAMAATAYTPKAGGTTSFKKFLIMAAGDNVPNVTFNFKIRAAAGDELRSLGTHDASVNDGEDNATFQVDAGINPAAIKINGTAGNDGGNVSFVTTDTTYATAQDGDTDVTRLASARVSGGTEANGVQFTENAEKYAKKDVSLDFTGVQFTEPGVYRYIITETANADHAAAGIIHDTDVDRVLDVYVTDNGSGVLEVSQYVLHTDLVATQPAIGGNMGTDDVTSQGGRLSDKTDGFTNEYKSKDLDFKKEVTGNQASRDKYFRFKLELSGLTAGNKYTVSLANDSNEYTNDGDADAKSGTTVATRTGYQNQNNVTELTAASDGTIGKGNGNEVYFYLQHGQHIVVRGLPLNAKYNVTEDKEDYKQEASSVDGYTALTDSGNATIGSIAGDAKIVKTSWKNTRSGNIPTGVLASIIPGLALVGVGGAGFLASRKRRSEEE